MNRASARQFIIIFILVILTACGGKPTKERSTNAGIDHGNEGTVIVNKASTRAPSDTGGAYCADYTGMGTFDPENESYIGYLENQKEYFKGKTRLSDDDSVIRKLFSNLDSIPDRVRLFSKHDTVSTSYYGSGKTAISSYISNTDFYFIGRVLKEPLFTGIVYEEIKEESSRSYFSTVDRHGNFISRVQLAFYGQRGTYLDDVGSRHPYYTGTSGCIDKSGIEIDDDGVVDNKYNIHPDGQIVEFNRDRFDSLLWVDPNNAETHLKFALYFEGKDDYVNSRKQFEQALKLKPRSAAIYNEYAKCLGHWFRDTLNAKPYYEKAIALAPDSANYYTSYASFLADDANDKKNARIQYEKGIASVPGSSDLQWYYAQFLLQLNLIKEARQHYFKAVKLDPKAKNKENDRMFHIK